MSNHQSEGKQKIIVIKLGNVEDGTSIKLPGLLSSDQYLRAWDYDGDVFQSREQTDRTKCRAWAGPRWLTGVDGREDSIGAVVDSHHSDPLIGRAIW